MAVNARDEQIIRQSVVQTTAKARDEQIIRQSVVQTTAKARDVQIFRQTICVLGGTGVAGQLLAWTDPAFGFKGVIRRNMGLYQQVSVPVFVTNKVFPIIFCVT